MKTAILALISITALCTFSTMLIADPVLNNKQTRIVFSQVTGGISSITDLSTKHEFISSPAAKPGLWKITARKADGNQIDISSSEIKRPSFKTTKGSISLKWEKITVDGITGYFTVNVKGTDKDGLLHLGISVVNNTDASISSVFFPEISGFGTSGESDIAFPKYNWGEMFRDYKGTIAGYYPSSDTPMQFCSMSDDNNTIYLATHDADAMYKIFHLCPGSLYSVETSIPNATVPGNDWIAPFDFVLKTYQGDWMESCKLYRKWAIKSAPWTAKGPISRRKDISPVIKQVGVWLNMAEDFAANEKSAVEIKKKMGVPVGIHWYTWHTNPFDRDYPDYLPARPGFVEAVRQLKEAGIYSMPYINGRLWDTQNKNYDQAKPHATTNMQGEPNLEDYGSGTKLAVMCLGDSFWQSYLTKLICQVADETDVQGIYIDQVAGAPITECYNKSHGHTLGRDKWWIEGYRKSITAARNICIKKHGSFFVGAENNAEPYMDFVDLFLIWIPKSQNDIPMMTAVYSGYTQYFGTNRAYYDDMSFAMMQARDFTWGAQLFWESPYILQPEHKEKLKILTNLARLRYRCRKYIVEGELINLIKPLNAVPEVSGLWGGWTKPLEDRTLPAVHAALWKSSNGSYAAILANADIIDHTFQFRIDPSILKHKTWSVSRINQDRTDKLNPIDKNNDIITVNIPARDGLALQIEQKQ